MSELVAQEGVEETKEAEPVDTRSVKLISNDGEEFIVPITVAKLSKMVATGIEGYENDDADDDDDTELPVITLPFVKASALSKAVEYMTHYAEEKMEDLPKPLRTGDMKDATSAWYTNFVKSMENEPLFELILAANFMDISPLLELTCAAVAIQFRDAKTPQEIAKTFGITRQYKEPDEKRIREVYPWSTV